MPEQPEPDVRRGGPSHSGSSGITTPYTDTYVYSQDGTPLGLLRQTASSTTPYWLVLDGQSNVVALTNSAGSVVDSYSYPPMGQDTQRQ